MVDITHQVNGHGEAHPVTSSTSKAGHAHPLDPLSPAEINAVVQSVNAHATNLPENKFKPKNLLFNSISLKEPPKAAVLAWTGLFTENELGAVPDLKREADVSCQRVAVTVG